MNSTPSVSTFRYRVLSEKNYPGINKNQTSTTPRELEVDFYQIIEPYLKEIKRHLRKEQKQYWGHFLQPSMSSALINCNYYIRVKAFYKVLMGCCGSGPTLFLPISLIPPPQDPIIIDYSSSFIIPEGDSFPNEEHEIESEVQGIPDAKRKSLRTSVSGTIKEEDIREVMVHDYAPPPIVAGGEGQLPSQEVELPLLK